MTSSQRVTCLQQRDLGFRDDTRSAIPGWDGLMYVNAVCIVPTFFALLVGVNVLVWARARINYVFIFGMSCWPNS